MRATPYRVLLELLATLGGGGGGGGVSGGSAPRTGAVRVARCGGLVGAARAAPGPLRPPEMRSHSPKGRPWPPLKSAPAGGRAREKEYEAARGDGGRDAGVARAVALAQDQDAPQHDLNAARGQDQDVWAPESWARTGGVGTTKHIWAKVERRNHAPPGAASRSLRRPPPRDPRHPRTGNILAHLPSVCTAKLTCLSASYLETCGVRGGTHCDIARRQRHKRLGWACSHVPGHQHPVLHSLHQGACQAAAAAAVTRHSVLNSLRPGPAHWQVVASTFDSDTLA